MDTAARRCLLYAGAAGAERRCAAAAAAEPPAHEPQTERGGHWGSAPSSGFEWEPRAYECEDLVPQAAPSGYDPSSGIWKRTWRLVYRDTWRDSRKGVWPVEWRMSLMTYVLKDGELCVQEQWRWRYVDEWAEKCE